MRYHFGFGVGHVYSRRPNRSAHSPEQRSQERDIGAESDKESQGGGHGPCDLSETVHLEQGDSSSDGSTDDDKDSQNDLDPTDDDEFRAFKEMYDDV